MDILSQLVAVSKKFPLMRAEDYFKLLFISEYLGGHFISDEQDSFNRLVKEAAQNGAPLPDESLSDDFLNVSRVNLRPFVAAEKNLRALNRLFVNSNLLNVGTKEGLQRKIDCFVDAVKQRKIDLPYLSVKRKAAEYAAKGYPLTSHSPAYKMNYYPSYRVVRKDFWFLFDVIDAINSLAETRLSVTVGIDGNSGAGKTFFANALKEYFDCNLLSADDFFLPLNMRTPQRLGEVGGNIHYERLRKTLLQMKDCNAFTYLRYDCHTDSFEEKHGESGRINIVEGCYSLHPYLREFYDLCVVINVGKREQYRRIFDRDGQAVFERYKNEWIPKEDAYLEKCCFDSKKTIFLNSDGYLF